jgi:hypothetical protein
MWPPQVLTRKDAIMFIKEFSGATSLKSHRVTSGLMAGTLVEDASGWLAVEDLRIGDAVHSYDGGLARIVGLDRDWTPGGAGAFALHLPGGAMDNCSDLILLPGQNLLVDTLGHADFPDDIAVLIPALALDGVFGTSRIKIEKPMEVITPRFADDEVIFANSGTLLHCPGIRQTAGAPASAFFRQLDLAEGQAFMRGTNRAFSVLYPCHAA